MLARALFCHLNESKGLMTSITSNGYVEFKFFRREVSSVSLVGDFNGWDQHSLAMDSVGDGWWTTTLRFDAGEYRFRYLADGQWFNDFASYGVEPTRMGFNSILMIPQRTEIGSNNLYQEHIAKQVA